MIRTLTVVAVAAILALAVVQVYRAQQVNATAFRLCHVLHSLVARSGATVGNPGTPGYAYFHAHPRELRAARTQNNADLRLLDCRHLPTGGG